ncbi:flavin reductase [Vibrio breoganii]|uniref:SDR family NAD(P)-dependent oxidoreductase n=1 Tax=Vibrio breoganii TaxID=553239 RepID=UPI000C86219A|nr:SDR family NAD(P)-dependent oxidoreductase [Vibrio breoganii]PMP06396.1 flavin reductase [Vibrio breoganii]
MQKIVIWGAASGLGAAMVAHFVEQGFDVTAVARSPSRNPMLDTVSTLTCDATDKGQVEVAVDCIAEDAWVISCMGSFQSDNPVDYIGHRYLIDALQAKGVKRFLLVTSLGCGDSWQYLSDRAKQVFGSSVREKSLAESWLQTSALDFTILRPGGLKDGEANQRGVLSQHGEIHGSIHRAEVARLVHELLLSQESVGKIYQCVES